MTLKHETLQILKDYPDLSSAAIFERAKGASTLSALVVQMSTLKQEGLVEISGKSEPDPKTGRSANLWQLTPAGVKALAEAPREKAAGGGTAKPDVKKVARATPRRAKGAHKKTRKHKTRKTAKPKPQNLAARSWAFTEGGTFVLLNALEPIEVSQSVARELVNLVRAGADVAHLVAFIEKLDAGEA